MEESGVILVEAPKEKGSVLMCGSVACLEGGVKRFEDGDEVGAFWERFKCGVGGL